MSFLDCVKQILINSEIVVNDIVKIADAATDIVDKLISIIPSAGAVKAVLDNADIVVDKTGAAYDNLINTIVSATNPNLNAIVPKQPVKGIE